MEILDIAGRTRKLGAPKDWNAERDGDCGGLPIRDEAYAPGVNRMVSEWKPNEIELEHLKLGAPIQLGVVGTVHPVVSLGVGAVPPRDREEPTARMSRIQALMSDLERHPEDMTYSEGTKLFAQARQLILDLLGISAKPVGEQIAAAIEARVRAECPDEPGDLDTSVRFARRWLPECLPAEDDGKVPFARALFDSVLAAAEGHLKREASAPTPEAGSDLAARALELKDRLEQRGYVQTRRGAEYGHITKEGVDFIAEWLADIRSASPSRPADQKEDHR